MRKKKGTAQDERRTIRRGFLMISDGKRNPNSIRRLFFDYVHYRHRGNQGIAEEALREFTEKEMEKDSTAAYRGNTISRTSLSKIFTDAIYVQYWHLELLARKIGIPMGFMLLYSRMQSNAVAKKLYRRLENEIIAKTAISVFSEYLDSLEEQWEEGDVEETVDFRLLEKWASRYQEIREDVLKEAIPDKK